MVIAQPILLLWRMCQYGAMLYRSWNVQTMLASATGWSCKPNYKGRGGLTAKMRRRLTSAAGCAIKMRSTHLDRKEAVKLLQRDLLNSPHHCFGIHSNCSSEYCKVAILFLWRLLKRRQRKWKRPGSARPLTQQNKLAGQEK